MGIAAALDKAIKAVCPIHGVRVGEPNKRETWSIDFKPGATKAEKDAAKAVLDAFEYVEPVKPTVADVEAEIDNLSNIASIKAFLKARADRFV